jgi:hypothetical protein
MAAQSNMACFFTFFSKKSMNEIFAFCYLFLFTKTHILREKLKVGEKFKMAAKNQDGIW